MKRVAFTIVLNGMKHLLHNNYAEFILKNFDHWYVVEGVSRSTGSTSWCNEMPQDFHCNYHSIDGTLEYLQGLTDSHTNLTVISREGGWDNKDCMVNAAAQAINQDNGECFVWEIDVDEQWSKQALYEAEDALLQAKGKTGMFLAKYYVGKDIIAVGEWGEGTREPYRRLWHWNKDTFHIHEPPSLRNGDEPKVMLPQRFNHFAYYYEDDVIFKDKWYGSSKGVHANWLSLQTETVFPQPIRRLLPGGFWSTVNAQLIKESQIKLNLGCGGNILPGWQNHDMDVDLSKPLPYANQTIEKIFAEHVIEHLTSAEMLYFFEECYRVLKVGGVLRVVFPDIEQTMTRSTEEYVKFAMTYVPMEYRSLPMTAWHSLARCHGHKQMLTQNLIHCSLQSLPFSIVCNAPLYTFDGELVDGHHKAIGKPFHELESVAMEAVK